MHQSFQNSASGQTAHFFYFLYFPFIVASRLSSANTVSKYTLILIITLTRYLIVLPCTERTKILKPQRHVIIIVSKAINHNIYIRKSDMTAIMGEMRVCRD